MNRTNPEFHTEIIAMKHLIQGCNNEAWVKIKPSPCDHGSRENDARNHARPRC